MQRVARLTYQILAWLFVVGALLQFFLAGLGVFGTGASFEIHATLGIILVLVSIALLILAGLMTLTGNLTWHYVTSVSGLVVLMIVQYLLVELFSERVAALAALHPLNGLIVLGLAVYLATESRSFQFNEPRQP